MGRDNPIGRHSRAGGNPARTNIPRVRGCCRFIGFTTTAYPLLVCGQHLDFVPLMKQLAIRLMELLAIPLDCQRTTIKWLVISWQKTPAKSLVIRGDYSNNWIPACAGMTLFPV